MGFIDLSGSLGRHFGSIGVALNEISTRLSITSAAQRCISGPSAQRAEKCLSLLCNALNVPDHLRIVIEEAIPEHVGLGSGTQLALALGAGLNAYYGLGLSIRDIAALTDRGRRSGIGIGVFEQGGLVVDGGRGENTVIPPVLSRMPVPEDWRFILTFDERGQGLHGQQETQAFASLPAFSQGEAARLCYLLLMQGLPAVAEHNLNQFGDVISQLQTSVGEHFAVAQGGVFASPEVADAMSWFKQQGAVAIGQTSWGPTGFCAVANQHVADTLVAEAKLKSSGIDTLRFMVASARNDGGQIWSV
jgi:beta-ribofuranosylaminobenzene 5'-phosphate synthase